MDAPPEVSVAFDLLQVAALMPEQALAVLEAWQDVDGASEAGPAVEFAATRVGGD